MRYFVAIAGLCALAVAAADKETVYRCADPKGRPVFSDAPCGEAAQKLEFDIHKSYYRQTMEDHEKRKAEWAEREKQREAERITAAQERAVRERARAQRCLKRRMHTGLEIGMDRSELLASDLWGMPSEVSSTTTKDRYREYLVYDCGEYGRIRMYVTNGKLESIHD